MRWGATDSGPDRFDGANGIATDGGGNVYVADLGGRSIKKFTGDGVFLALFQSGASVTAWDVAIGPSGTVFTIGGADSVIGEWSDACGQCSHDWGWNYTRTKRGRSI